MPNISIIIPHLKSQQFIKECLDSVYAQDYRDFEIIVVDNGSNDGAVNFINKNFPHVVLIVNKENLGACKARNQGIEVAQGKWILALDCDVILKKDFFNKLMHCVEQAKGRAGFFQPKILNSDKTTIYSCGIYFSKLKRFCDIGKGKSDGPGFNVPRHIFGVCSATGLYSRKMLEELKEDTGYFDERFFFLAEDVDLACRAQKNGWRALFCPQAICYHYGNSSSSDKLLRQFLCWRNRKFLLKKQRLNRFQEALIYLCYDFPRLVFLFFVNSYIRDAILRRNGVAAGGNVAAK